MRIFVTVKFEKKKEKIKKERENRYTIFIKSPPEQGKANEEVVEEISKYFNKRKEKVRIVSGFRSRKKVLFIKEDKLFDN